MTTYAVTVDVAARQGATLDAVDRLLDLLAPHGGSVAGGPDHHEWSATLTVEAPDVTAAAATGVDEVLRAGRAAKMPAGDVAALEVLTADEQDRRLAEPSIPDLAGAAEVAEILGISRQRVHQLLREHPRFPSPVVQVKLGPLWLRSSIEAFDRTWPRKPGRPSKTETAAQAFADALSTGWEVGRAAVAGDHAATTGRADPGSTHRK